MCSKSRGKTHLAGQVEVDSVHTEKEEDPFQATEIAYSESHSVSIEFISTNQPSPYPSIPSKVYRIFKCFILIK